MVTDIRKCFNQEFSIETYQHFLADLDTHYPGAIEFRLAETPVFISKEFTKKMTETCDYILTVLNDPRFITHTDISVPLQDHVSGDEGHPHFLAFDFGVCKNEKGEYVPNLIEMQGFPSLFGFQELLADVYRKHYSIPENYSHLFSGLTKSTYISLLKEIILGNSKPEHVILLDVKPDEQKTRIDFRCMENMIGIKSVCITELINEGNDLYYLREGVKTKVERIYNRIIFDELNAKKETLGTIIDIRKNWNVFWVTHPNWFYRISKFTLPFLDHPNIPETWFLHELKEVPKLEEFVLKPLFSFAGQGVLVDVKPEDIERIADPENWILQRKVEYAPVIETPDEPAKLEIRLMYLWKNKEDKPVLATNLARLSKGKMIGVDYNRDKTWVGGSIAFFEQ